MVTQKNVFYLASSVFTRGEALFRCATPSGVPRGPATSTVPRGPATSTGSLASQRHPGKFPKVPGRRRGWLANGEGPPRQRAGVWGKGRGKLPLVRRQGSQVSMHVARGSASSSVWEAFRRK